MTDTKPFSSLNDVLFLVRKANHTQKTAGAYHANKTNPPSFKDILELMVAIYEIAALGRLLSFIDSGA